MMLAHYRALAAYNTWMNERLYAAAAELPAAERQRDLGAFFGSLQRTLGHILLADRVWLARFSGDAERFTSRTKEGASIPVTSLDQELYPDYDQLTSERAATDRDIVEFTAALSEERLGEVLRFRTMSGVECEHPLWCVLSHLFNHQTHHRGQATTLLKQLGRDPGSTDLIAFLRL
jgi:uncharacterized damage-inducible protein DinB